MGKRIMIAISGMMLMSMNANGQGFMGYQQSNENVISNISQPSLIVNNNYSISANAFSFNAWIGNNIYAFNKSYLFSTSSNSAVEGKDYFKNFSNSKSGGAFNLDWVGPSVSYNIDNKNYVGIYTRFRQMTNISDINSDILQLIGVINNNYYNQSYHASNMRINVHNFAEIGFSYGRELVNTGNHVLSAGANIKYLLGGTALSFDVHKLNVNIQDSQRINTLNGDISSYYSNNVNDLSNAFLSGLGNRGGGGSIGLDLGINYKYYNDNSSAYLFRVSMAVTDIGSIKYTAAQGSNEYKFNADGATLNDIQVNNGESLNNYFQRMQNVGYIQTISPVTTFKESLPTALRGNIDFHIASGFYANANALLNLLSSGSNGAAYVNTFILSPRYESKWFSGAIPFSLNAFGNASCGIMLKGGPLFIGSGSFLSDLFSSNVNHADVYIGLQWTFNKQNKRKQ